MASESKSIEFGSESMPSDSDDAQSHAIAFFQRAQHLVVSGGNFTNNIMHNVINGPLGPFSEFRMIPLGDLDLQVEIRVGHARRRHGRGSVQRIYSARIDGHLIPVKQYLEWYRHLPISNIYLYSHFYTAFENAQDYFMSVCGKWLGLDCTFWIRKSTSTLCLALSPNSKDIRVFFPVL
ncbi:hypothetical protein C8R44DRAFT_882774 [Mycena epipterygia]|nr:hypothetical protein C8R44DRAFT_882774 [Mycena epipterygia]